MVFSVISFFLLGYTIAMPASNEKRIKKQVSRQMELVVLSNLYNNRMKMNDGAYSNGLGTKLKKYDIGMIRDLERSFIKRMFNERNSKQRKRACYELCAITCRVICKG